MQKNLRIIAVNFSKSCNTIKGGNSFNQTMFLFCQSQQWYDTKLEIFSKDKYVKISASKTNDLIHIRLSYQEK